MSHAIDTTGTSRFPNTTYRVVNFGGIPRGWYAIPFDLKRLRFEMENRIANGHPRYDDVDTSTGVDL